MASGWGVTAAGGFRTPNRDKVLPLAQQMLLIRWEDLYSEREAELVERLVLRLLVVTSWLPGITGRNVPLLSSRPPTRTFAKNPGEGLGALPAVLQV